MCWRAVSSYRGLVGVGLMSLRLASLPLVDYATCGLEGWRSGWVGVEGVDGRSIGVSVRVVLLLGTISILASLPHLDKLFLARCDIPPPDVHLQ
jgi:hypothetical protein